LICLALAPAGCAPAPRAFIDPFDDGEWDISGYAEGEVFDATHTAEEFLRLSPRPRGPVPPPSVRLGAPRIVVSLDGLVCRLFDAQGDFESVYPIGVGVREDRTGESITPLGDYRTHPDNGDGWFYIWERWVPEYFAGFPFLRIDARSSDNAMTYGLHGPITAELKRGYVSHGCIRMRGDDVRELFRIVYASPPAQVRIQKEPEYSRYGILYDSDYPRYHAPDEPIPPLRVTEGLEIGLSVALSEAPGNRLGLTVSSSVRGQDANQVRYVLYNDGARWNGNLAPPVPLDAGAVSLTFESPGPRKLYAIGLDEQQRPVAYGVVDADVDG
jgi:hypothetical protein